MPGHTITEDALEAIEKESMQGKAKMLAAKSVVGADVEESIKNHSERRSEPYASRKATKKMPMCSPTSGKTPPARGETLELEVD